MDDEETRAVDNSPWDGNAAMVKAGASDDPAAAFAAICAGRRDGPPDERQTWALPHHRAQGDPPNADGVRNSLSRLPQTQGLINEQAAQRHLDAHMSAIAAGRSERPPRDNLVRAMPSDAGVSEDGRTLYGHFARFNEWTKIDSVFEGTFMERIAPGAFRQTFATKGAGIRVLFQHGRDPQVGDKPIAAVTELREDDSGAYYEASLLDSVPPLVLDGLRAGLYGASFRFRVMKEDFERRPKASAHNPDALPERTVEVADVMEFGPVTFPAYAGATAGVRSLTDYFVLPPERVAELLELAASALPTGPATATPPESRDDPPEPPPDAAPSQTTDPPGGGSLHEERTIVDYTTPEDRDARIRELKEIIERQSIAFPGVLPPDEQTRYDADNKELDALLRDKAAWEARQERLRQLGGNVENAVPAYSPPAVVRKPLTSDIYDFETIVRGSTSLEDRDQRMRDSAQRSVETSVPGHPQAKVDDFRAGLSRFLDTSDSVDKEVARLILTTGSPQYKRAFNKYLRGVPLSPEESRAAALAVTGTTTTGGYMVPYVFDPTFINIGAHTSINPYRSVCRVVTIAGGNNWKAVTSSAITAAWNAEANAETEQGPTIGQPSYTVQRASAFATVSIETLEDRPDIGDELGVLFQEAKDNLEENSFTLGAGTTVYPQGIALDGAFTAVTTTTNDVTAIADTTKVETALPIRHRASAVWFMSRSTQRQLEALDTTGYYFKSPGQLAFAMGMNIPRVSPIGSTGSLLLGYPIYETPSMVSTLTTDASILAVLFNPNFYVIVDRIGMSVEVIPHMLNGATPSFPTGQRGIFAMWRATARVLAADGGRQLKVQ